MKPTTKRCVLSCLAVLALSAVVLAVRGEEQRPHSRAEFMRTKLEYSKKALEGLTLEDYDTIAKSAKALRLLSQAAEWEVPTIPNATDYVTSPASSSSSPMRWPRRPARRTSTAPCSPMFA